MSNNNAETREVVIKREDLSDKHRLYVEYLSGQLRDIFRDKGLASENDIKVDTFTDEERKRIEKYQENIYHILTRGELPQVEDSLTNEFKKELNEFFKRYEIFNSGPISNEDFLVQEIINDSIPKLKPELLLFDSTVLQKIYSEIHGYYEGYVYTEGAVVSVIYNESASKLDSALRDQIVQEINLNQFRKPINYIGHGLEGGQLTVKGKAGDYLACGMKGGRIVAEKAEDFAGDIMYGGELEIKEAGHFLGSGINGGKITVGKAGESVGPQRLGGEINITQSYKSIAIAKDKSGGKVFFRGKRVG